MITLTLTVTEVEALLDALVKGASRHQAFARFKPQSGRTAKHEKAAEIMLRLHARLMKR